MILTCPNCGTQYVVKDGAIPPEGRQVRCAACKHSWHQNPEDELASTPAPETPGVTIAGMAEAPSHAEEADPAAIIGPSDEGESLAEATLIEPRAGPEAEQRAYEEAMVDAESDPAVDESPYREAAQFSSSEATSAAAADWNEPATSDASPDTFSPFAEDGEVEPRRRGRLIAILIVLLIVIVAAAIFWFVAPTALKAKLGIAAAGSTPLQLVTTHMDRSPLESGNELLTVTGRVINPSGNEQDVPPIQAQLKDRNGKVVYTWTIQPPAHSLAAGASASFNSAEVNVPPGGDELTITLGEPKA